MRLHRTALAGIALGALLPVSAAEAGTGVSPAGRAVSSATLASIRIGGIAGVVEATEVSLGSLTASAGTMSAKAPSITFVPLTLNGVQTGAVTVTPANSPKSVGAIGTGDLGVVAATSPAATLKAADGSARSSSITSNLGSAKILGLPVTLQGGVDAGSVTDATHARAGKALTLKNVALPNIADVLAALGIDLKKLPVATLNALVEDLSLTISATAQQAMDSANNAVATAQQAYEDSADDVDAATADLATKAASFESALSGATIPDTVTLPEGATAPLNAAEWSMLTTEVQAAIDTATTTADLAALAAAFEAAKAALAAAEAAVAGLQQAIDDAVELLAGVVEGILGGIPLVSVGEAAIGTKAQVGKAKSADVTGTISGVKVLGTDILSAVTGNSALDVADVAGDLAQDVNATLNTVSVALSNALSSATGATGLVVPAPKIALLQKNTSTGVDGAYGLANASVTALSISLGSVTVPAAYAVEDAAGLPGLAAVTGGFKSAPIAVKVGVLGEAARFRPGTAGGTAPTTPSDDDSHPATGGPEGLAIVAVIGAALAVGVRRRLRAGAE